MAVPDFFRGGGGDDVILDFTLVLNEQLYAELLQCCQECKCSPTQFAAEALESVLASRRLPNVAIGKHGARIGVAEK